MLSKAKQEHRPTDLYSKGTGKNACRYYSLLTESNDVQNSPGKFITTYIFNSL